MSAPGDAAELAALERRRLKALVDADTETAESIHANDFQLVTPSGTTYSKTEYLASIKRRELQYLVWEPVDIDARVSGDAGCVRYRSRLNIVVSGFENGLGDYWHTDYYEKRGGRWRIVFSQATAIATKTTPIEMPEVKYARTGDFAIAYQVIGGGPLDVVLVPDWVSNLIWAWHTPYWRNFYERLGSFARLIVFDKRGTGLSDRPHFFPDLETRIDDLRAVLDAVGSERAALVAAQEGCWMASLFAATYPERTRSLALYHPWIGRSDPRFQRDTEEDLLGLRESWGAMENVDGELEAAPTLAADDEFRLWMRDNYRLSASPGSAYAFWKAASGVDFREIYPAVHVPTLVLYRAYRPDARGMYGDVARLIADARLVELPGEDYRGIFLEDPAREIEAFLRDLPYQAEPDRVLTTVLFTDLVGSTERLAALGDAGWRELVGQHHELVRRTLNRYRGTEIDTAGDGFYATFDGPARAIRCARAIQAEIADLGMAARAGVHTGECELIDGKPGGLTVVVGSRISAAAEAGEVLVSATVKDLVAGSDISFQERGERPLKGVPGTWQLYAVDSA